MKNISSNLIGFIIATLICVVSYWVYFDYIQKKDFQIIDNPTKETLNVTIDNKKYIVAPNQSLEIELASGKHTMLVTDNNGSEILPSTQFSSHKERGLINPTLSRYYIYGMPYGPKVNKDSIFKNLKTTFKGKTYLGDLKIDSAIYSEDFYYNINENYPDLTLKSENETLRTKIFREGDFKQFYFENYE